jgi:protein-disulfide isomerase-like protein with CxxC motif
VDRSELARRLKAARALAGYTKPETLAQQPLLLANGIKASRIKEMESVKGRVEVRPMELDVIAEACGLPREFFSAPFERMAENAALAERMEAVERALEALAEAVPDLATLRAEAARQAAEDEAASSRPGHVDPKQQG